MDYFKSGFDIIYFYCNRLYTEKNNLSNTDASKVLSSLLVNIFLPCKIFQSFSSQFTIKYITAKFTFLLVSAAIVLLLSVIAHFVVPLFSKDKFEKNIYEYSLIIPNYGYMGYALAEVLLGNSGLMNIMTFALPSSLYIYTIGFAKLTKKSLNFKELINPVMFSTVLGITAGLVGIRLPAFLTTAIKSSADCMAPVSMVLTGIVVSNLSFKKCICNSKIYCLIAFKMILLPIIIGVILKSFFDASLVQTAVLFYSLPCGLNTVVFPKLVHGNSEIGASLALITTIFSCITLPIILGLFNIGG